MSLERKCLEWMLGDDTGVSSETMVAVACGINRRPKSAFRVDAPYDPSDFGRCYRLVQQIPEIRNSFHHIGKAVPVFAGILENWDELVELYLRDLPTGRSDELYKRIKQLRGDR